MIRQRTRLLALLGAFLALTLGEVAVADVQPGDVITRANAAQVRDLVSPALFWCVEHGLPMRIVATKPVTWPPRYREATEKYSSQVKLSADGLRLEGYVAGAPFPHVDDGDPMRATKLVWDYNYKPINNDDFDLRNFDADTGSISDRRPMDVERHYVIEHFRRLWYVNRLYVEPKPVLPNSEGLAYKETLHPLDEPFDLKGVGITYHRFLDPAQQDEIWLYFPTLRRVRRLSTAQRSDALLSQDTDLDSYYGYSGQPGWMEWKYLGERELLAVRHAEHFPVKWADPPADWAFDDVWEKIRVWVVEGVSRVSEYGYSKRVLFIDQDNYTIPYTDLYDRGGELWKIWINDVDYATKPFASATTAVYPFEQPFAPAILMVDVQLAHATRAALPSPAFPGEEGWYYNMGARSGTTEDAFTIAELIKTGH